MDNRENLFRQLIQTIVTRNRETVFKHGPSSSFYALMLSIKLQWNPFFFTDHQNVNKPKSRAARTVSGPICLPFYKIIVSLLSFFCQDANKKQDQTVQVAICQRNANQHCIKHRTENQTTQIISFSLIFARSYLHKNLGTVIQILLSLLFGWCINCVTLRLHDIKKLQCPLNAP